jgi:hypothetical protein
MGISPDEDLTSYMHVAHGLEVSSQTNKDRNWGCQAFEVAVGMPLLRGQAPSAAFEFVFIYRFYQPFD